MNQGPGGAYDLFLSHHSSEKELVEKLAYHLREAGFSLFLDDASLTPGEPWVRALEEALQTSRAVAVCLGATGVGSWMEKEIHAALTRAAKDPSFLLLPIILPGGSRQQLSEASLFLGQSQACDLRRGFEGRDFQKLLSLLEAVRSGTPLPTTGHDVSVAAEILKVFERLQSRFSESLHHNLAGGQLIPRQETQNVLEHLAEDDTRLVVVHGAAGIGKSGVLLELARAFQEDGTIYLPLRLDRLELRGEPRQFGRQVLNLPDSPAKCLAQARGDYRGVLLLDQLDALRWTGAHSSEAWDVCREVIEETLRPLQDLKVVVCCRSFDLQHDPQFRGWKEETKNLREVQVQELSQDQVREAIERVATQAGEARAIVSREMKLLQHVHHLQMWITLYRNAGSVGPLGSRRALMDAFWRNRRSELADLAETSPDRIEKIEDRLVDAMKSGARLTASLSALRLTEREVKAYRTLQIFQLDQEQQRVSFCHQSYLDYLVALRLSGELTQGNGNLMAWLGPKAEQSLFRREQLRLVLEELRHQDSEIYLRELRVLLEHGEEARFHLRLLGLQFLAQLSVPSPSEEELVLELLDQSYWREHVLGEVVRGHVPWFETLDDAGRFETWLASDDEKRRESALEMVLYAVEKSGDRVAGLLRPYLGKDETWARRIAWVLRPDPSEDSDVLFDLRFELIKQGALIDEHVRWDKLAEKHPARFVVLACQLLYSLAESLLEGQDRRRPGRRSELDWYSFEKVTPNLIPKELWTVVWESLFRAVAVLARICRFRGEEEHVLESYVVEFETLEPVLRLLRDLGRSLLEENWLELVTLGESLSKDGRRVEIIFLDCLRQGPAHPDLADWALGWLMADPWRARLQLRRDAGPWRLSGQLIERFAPVCSLETFQRLEDWLLSYREPDFAEHFRRRDKWIKERGDLSFQSWFGRTPHALLPKLPSRSDDQPSSKVAKHIAELGRKFGAQSASDYDEGGHDMGGYGGSPIREQARKVMTDSAWLKLASSAKLVGKPGPGRLRLKEGYFEEASPEMIASDFRQATQREPERFGRLLTRWPADGHPAFLKAILSGLAFPGDQIRPSDQETPRPPSHALLEEILGLPAVQQPARSDDDTGVAKDLCTILGRYAEYPWSDTALDFVVWVAQYHGHPAPDYFLVGSIDDDSEGFDRLATNALNVTRGGAGYAIRALLFKHPAFFDQLRPAIESLIRDAHPAVRVAAVAACLPVVNIDRDLAVELFLEACAGSVAALVTGEARDFIRYTYRSHLDQLLPTIDLMVSSELPKVATAGSTWIAAAYLVTGRLEDRFEQCLASAPQQRKGVAEVAASLLGESDYADAAKATLLKLAKDTDEKVAQAVARSFRKLDLRQITEDREAWKDFARSKAFQTDPTHLLLALEKQSGNLIPFADCVLAVGKTFAEELAEAALDPARGFAGDARYLLPLLLRLYEQTKIQKPEIHRRCLDLWDRLLERRVGTAMGLTRELDSL